MHFTFAAGLLALASAASAWDVTIYSEPNCNQAADGSFSYYIVTGSVNECYALGTDPPSGVSCVYFTDGGRVGPLDCAGGFTQSGSFYISGGDCYFSKDYPQCYGDGFGSSQTGCQNQNIQSFTCNAGT